MEATPSHCLVSYDQLRSHFAQVAELEELDAIVNWDQAVNTPAGAGPRRARALAALSRLHHRLLAEPQIDEWLDRAQQESHLGKWERANLREISRLHRRATALSTELVQATTLACKESELAWRRYRAENAFESFAPYLEVVVDRQRDVAQALADRLGVEPYDALMDAHEPGLRAAEIDLVFAPLRTFLPDFIDEVVARQKDETVVRPEGPFPIEMQRKLALRMMVATGLDMTRVRLDESHHPFCGGVPTDVRITNRYQQDEFLSGLMGVLHESGHAKYEQRLPEAFLDQPVGKARGMVLHESQSLLQEMQVCRGLAFMHHLRSVLKEVFPASFAQQPDAYGVENLFRLQTRVRRSYIRVHADEVTYPAHILIRYELERELIRGTLRVRDLPEAWNEKSTTYLGLRTLGNDSDGCLQDVHWPSGAFGYFPLYTLGAMAAAQLFHAARSRLPELDRHIRRGDLQELNQFLDVHVFAKASSESVDQILRGATGQSLNPQCFLDHLRARYAGSQ